MINTTLCPPVPPKKVKKKKKNRNVQLFSLKCKLKINERRGMEWNKEAVSPPWKTILCSAGVVFHHQLSPNALWLCLSTEPPHHNSVTVFIKEHWSTASKRKRFLLITLNKSTPRRTTNKTLFDVVFVIQNGISENVLNKIKDFLSGKKQKHPPYINQSVLNMWHPTVILKWKGCW